jgi:surface carbohydrate biosynthesis protein
MYKSILTIFDLIKKKRLTFNLIKKSEILFLEGNYSNLSFKNYRVGILDLDRIYFFYFCKAFLLYFLKNKKKLNLYNLYKQILYRAHDAKLAIDHNLTGRAPELKKLCPKIKIIIYQVGFFEPYNKLILSLRKLISLNYKASDFFLIFSKTELPTIKQIGLNINKKIIIAGSIKNNERPIIFKKKNYDIMYISQHLTPGSSFDPVYQKKKISNQNISLINHNKDEAFIIKTINEYCKKYKKKSVIALRSLRKGRYNKFNLNHEVDHIEKALKKKFMIISKNSWDLADVSKLIITNCSTMGFELRSRGFNVLFLPLENNISKKYGIDKRNKLFPQKNEINICREYNKKLIFKKINFLLNLNKKLKKSPHFKRQINLLEYDNKNSILKELVRKLFLAETLND